MLLYSLLLQIGKNLVKVEQVGVQLQQIWPTEKEWKTRAREQQKQMILVYIQISQTPPKQQEQPLILPDSDSYASIASNQQPILLQESHEPLFPC